MAKNITLTWRGHSCFRIACEGYSLIVDPYAENSAPGYAPLKLTADQVICSHEHADHNGRTQVTLKASGARDPFEITQITCPHDDNGGRDRGMNLIHVFDSGDVRVAHFGDIGCPLSDEDLRLIGKLDAAMVPVGGHFTMEPAGIVRLIEELRPRVVIPMHYRFGSHGYPVIGTLEDYLKLVSGEVNRLDTDTITVTPGMPEQTVILQYREQE